LSNDLPTFLCADEAAFRSSLTFPKANLMGFWSIVMVRLAVWGSIAAGHVSSGSGAVCRDERLTSGDQVAGFAEHVDNLVDIVGCRRQPGQLVRFGQLVQEGLELLFRLHYFGWDGRRRDWRVCSVQQWLIKVRARRAPHGLVGARYVTDAGGSCCQAGGGPLVLLGCSKYRRRVRSGRGEKGGRAVPPE
jgi:hypothetical protein